MKDGTTFEFYWRHHGLYVDEHESLEQAVKTATYRADYGEAAYSHFETIENGALRVLSHEESGDLIDAQSNLDYEAYKQRQQEAPKLLGNICVLSERDQRKAVLETVYTQEAKDQALTTHGAFGDRLTFEPLQP